MYARSLASIRTYVHLHYRKCMNTLYLELISGPASPITKDGSCHPRRSFTMTSPQLASAPPPLHIIRSHTSAISALFISGDNERIYSGDISGLAVITSTRSFRPLASWKAHTDGLLGIEEWGKQVITSVCDSSLFKIPFCILMR
jgi:hypothetical protein